MCGDEKGRLWTYHITDLAKANFKSGKAIPATEVRAFNLFLELLFNGALTITILHES